jgi:hypothetical protein
MTPFDLTSGARSEVFTFQGPKGDSVQAAIEVACDGLFIFVEGFEFPVAKVDLFYRLESIGGKTAPQIIAYDTQREEAVAFAAFHADGTKVSFETGIEKISEDNFGDSVHGYPPEPMTSDNT